MSDSGFVEGQDKKPEPSGVLGKFREYVDQRRRDIKGELDDPKVTSRQYYHLAAKLGAYDEVSEELRKYEDN